MASAFQLRFRGLSLCAVTFLAQGVLAQKSPADAPAHVPSSSRETETSLVLTLNPYSNVNWTTDGQFKANLHTHTTNSDGYYAPTNVIDRYHSGGYDALAITDHDRVTWPWMAYGRDPQQLGMLAIAGNELSKNHHASSLFSTYQPVSYLLDNALDEIANRGGLATMCHPSHHWPTIFSVPGTRNPMNDSLRRVTRADFTAETWFRTTKSARGILMGNYSEGVGNALNLELLPDNTVRVLFQPPADQGTPVDMRSRLANDWGINTRDGQWHHLAATRVGSVISLYLDGRYMKQTNTTASFDLKGTFFYFGRDDRVAGLELDGDLDWPRLWSRGLSSNEIYNLSQRAMPGDLEGPSQEGIVFEFDYQSAPIPPVVLQYYTNLYSRHRRLFGIEVVTPSSDFSLDRKLWDLLLDRMMPQRPVWGLAVDDMHTLVQFGVGWVVMLSPQLSEAAAKTALQNGAFYFSTTTRGSGNIPDITQVPAINRISHDPENGLIQIEASTLGTPLPESAYAWISGGQTVHIGSTLNYRQVSGIGNYVRAEIQGTGGKTFTNPFGFLKRLSLVGITGNDKIYDGNTAATVTGHAQLEGEIGTDHVTLEGHPIFSFVDSNVGNDIEIQTQGYTLGGEDAFRYFLAPLTLRANILKADQFIHFPPIREQSLGDTLQLTATASSGLDVLYSVESDGAIFDVTQTALSFTKTGRINVTAFQDGDSNWNPAPCVTHSFIVRQVPLNLNPQTWEKESRDGHFHMSIPPPPDEDPVDIFVLGASAYDMSVSNFNFHPLQKDVDYTVSGQTVTIIPDPQSPYQFYRIGATPR